MVTLLWLPHQPHQKSGEGLNRASTGALPSTGTLRLTHERGTQSTKPTHHCWGRWQHQGCAQPGGR